MKNLTRYLTKNIRQNTHKLYMPTQKHILSLAKSVGFILKGKVDMVSAQYEYQYLYIHNFQKTYYWIFCYELSQLYKPLSLSVLQ